MNKEEILLPEPGKSTDPTYVVECDFEEKFSDSEIVYLETRRYLRREKEKHLSALMEELETLETSLSLSQKSEEKKSLFSRFFTINRCVGIQISPDKKNVEESVIKLKKHIARTKKDISETYIKIGDPWKD